MLPSLKRTTFIFLVLLALILTYVPMPVSSRPLAILHDRNSHTSNPSYIDDQLVFDVSIAFGTPRDRATTDSVRSNVSRFQYYSLHWPLPAYG
jgi:hypothetical protein